MEKAYLAEKRQGMADSWGSHLNLAVEPLLEIFQLFFFIAFNSLDPASANQRNVSLSPETCFTFNNLEDCLIA